METMTMSLRIDKGTRAIDLVRSDFTLQLRINSTDGDQFINKIKDGEVSLISDEPISLENNAHKNFALTIRVWLYD